MNSIQQVDLFVEDRAHEYFIRSLVKRVALEHDRVVNIQILCAAGSFIDDLRSALRRL